jgi:DNA-directed RNA polymerase sigma subunit (sigma70/sigma32)
LGVTVIYNDEPILVSEEVAEYLERDRKRYNAERRRDERHRSKSDFETVMRSQKCVYRNMLLDEVAKNLTLEKLREVIAGLSDDERHLLHLYFWEEMSMERIGATFGVSKMAISKRLKKLYVKMKDLMGNHRVLHFFETFSKFRFTKRVLVSFIVRGIFLADFKEVSNGPN